MRETSPPPLPTLTSSPPLVTRSQAEGAATTGAGPGRGREVTIGAGPGRGLEAAGTRTQENTGGLQTRSWVEAWLRDMVTRLRVGIILHCYITRLGPHIT